MFLQIKKGFTLVELLVVIALVGISATLISRIAIGNNLQKSRDIKRQSDVEALRSALEIYKSENKYYPETLSLLVPSFLQVQPLDPSTNTNYGYTPTTASGTFGTTACDNDDASLANNCQKYQLCSHLENSTATPSCAATAPAGVTWRYVMTQL